MITETIHLNEMGFFPEFFLGIGLLYLVVHGLFVSYNSEDELPLIQNSFGFLGILLLIMVVCLLLNDSVINLNLTSFNSCLSIDFLSFVAKLSVLFASIICLLLIQDYIVVQKINSFEYILLILFAILGLLLLCSANDLITAYLAIELQSLSFYMLAAFKKTSTYSIESGIKYFILGSFSSGLFLWGASLIYASSGTLNFEDFKDLFMFEGSSFYFKTGLIDLGTVNTFAGGLDFVYTNMSLIGLMFIFVSLFFKLSIAPFHVWSPDIYEGSASSSTFLFAVVPKISFFVLIVRLSYYAFPTFVNVWQEYVTFLIVISVVVGSVAGLEQRKIKSLLAYSSISHMSYLLLSFSTSSLEGFQMLFCYMLLYMGFSACIWSIFMLIRLKTVYEKKQNKDLGDLIMLRKSNSTLAILFLIVLFSIASLPPMVGFLAKLGIFLVAVQNSLYVIAILSIVVGVISAFYYLRIIKILYFEPVLVGRLYYPIKTHNVLFVVLGAYLIIFLFANPSIVFLVSHKIGLLSI